MEFRTVPSLIDARLPRAMGDDFSVMDDYNSDPVTVYPDISLSASSSASSFDFSGLLNSATGAAVNAAKNALGLSTPVTTVYRPLSASSATSKLPSWALPAGLGLLAILLIRRR